jgi:cytochrome c oxidase subunit 3
LADRSFLAHQFDDPEQQHEAANIGMWVFLATEVILFGGLFTGYTEYRNLYPEAFAQGSHYTEIALGVTMTLVLIGSSLTMALAVHSAQLGRQKALVTMLSCTMILGLAFLGLKSIEYYHKVQEHLAPGRGFHPEAPVPRQLEMFMQFYFVMTGLHALHMAAGILMLAVLLSKAWRREFSAAHHNAVEAGGLYWHFVDVIWIFLFPLLYLIDRYR